jgi:hypothetical protein
LQQKVASVEGKDGDRVSVDGCSVYERIAGDLDDDPSLEERGLSPVSREDGFEEK